MGNGGPGRRGIYGHVTEKMLAEIRDALQRRWESSLRARAALSTTSAVLALNDALRALRDPRPALPLGAPAPKLLPNSDT